MRRYSFLLTFLLLCASLTFGQTTVTVTGNLQDTFGTSVVTNAKVCFSLIDGAGQPIQDPRVVSTGVIIASDTQCVNPNGSGQVSTSLVGNDQISPAGTQWSVQYYLKGQYVHGDNFIFNTPGPYNLNNATPNTTIPIVPSPTGDTTYFRLDGGNSPITGGFTARGNNTFTGSNTFSGLLNCKNVEASVFCVDTTNTQGWAGSDPGAWINSAITALPSTGGLILITSGQYSVSTPIVGAQDATILCPTGASMASGAALLNYTPATGTLISWSNSALQLIGCTLKTSTSTSSIGLKLSQVNYSTNIERNHINGFFGGALVTGNGSSTFSTGVEFRHNLIDGVNANCGGGAGYGVSMDHARDITWDENQIYSVTDCATGNVMILDTGVGGIWLSDSTFEQGLHAGVIRNTNQGGAYGGAPAAIFAHGITWDLSPGGDALLFDSTLGVADIRFFCASCWFAGAGKNTAGSVVTSGAVGANVQGGSNIHFVGGTARINASWGFLIGTGGTNISVENVNIHANNQGNTAGVGGIKVAGPTGWRIEGNRSGNIIESGGNQAWGVDISGASTNGVLSANDLRNNTSGRVNYPAGVAQAAVDAPEFGSGTGLHFYGPTMWLEQAAPSGASGEEVCYGDSTAHLIKCSFNNTNFHPVPTTERGTCTMASGTCTFNYGASFTATPICVATWNGTGTLTGIVKAVPTTSNAAVTSSINTDTAVMQVQCDSNPN